MIDPTVLIFAAIAAAWILCVVPMVLGDRAYADQVYEETQQYKLELQMLEKHNDQSARQGTWRDVSTPYTRRFRMRRLRQMYKHTQKRRVRIFALLVLTVAGTGFAAVMHKAPLSVMMVCSLGVVGLVMWLLASVVHANKQRQIMDQIADSIRIGNNEPTVVMDKVDDVEEDSDSIGLPISNNPVPLTKPTYVQRPAMPRTVRTVDLNPPVVTPFKVTASAEDWEEPVLSPAVGE